MRVNAYAAPSAGQPLAPTTIERREVGANDVLIAIEYAGICHSDIHTVNGDWGPQPFPVVPGPRDRRHRHRGRRRRHPPPGRRPRRRRLHGQLVRQCTNCRNGDEQYCLEGMVGTYAATDRDGTTTQGGYSTHVVVDADYVLLRPGRHRPGRRRAAAVRRHHDVLAAAALERRTRARRSPSSGLGGLGHMAVKIAHALGAEVTVLSQSLKKQEDGLRLGADDYFATSDPGTFEQLAGRFDLIVNTVSAAIDLDAYLGLLAVDGTLVNVGAPAEPLQRQRLVAHRRPALASPAR